MKSNIKIYSTEYCPYCVRAKSYFEQNGLDFTEIDLTGKFAEINEMKQKTGHMTVPLIFVDDKFIGGYTDMIEKVRSGELVFNK